MPYNVTPPNAPAGELLAGRYQMERRIGQGGMAEVWVATDIELDRKVAVKLLKSNLAADPVVAERFRREAIAVARLSHPNIVAVHDVLIHQGRQAVVMQLVDGKNLRQLLDTQKRLGHDLTIHIGAAIAGALDEAHRAGFVHRDVKPGNILITSDGRVLLADFGIAKGLHPGDNDLTSDNVMMGTAKYLSPEQVRAHRLDGRADLYSLGLVLYECLAGRVPFLGESDADTALARLERDPTDLGHLRPTLPIGLINLIHKALARNPAHRPQSGADMRAALLAVDTSPVEIDLTPVEPPERISNPPRRAIGAGPGIPGDPHLTGAVQRTHREQPRRVRETRDRTPPAPAAIRGAPARKNEQRLAPARIFVSGLLIAAVIVAGILFISVSRGETPDLVPTNTVDSNIATATAPPAVAEIANSANQIMLVAPWDPFGDNGHENDAEALLALADGDPTNGWSTECYQDQHLGDKPGVGLILSLATPSTGTLNLQSLNAPYQIDVFYTDAAEPPTDFAAWQPIGDTRSAQVPASIAVPVEIAANHLLVWLTQLGDDGACSRTNPFRGRLGEISFQP